MSNDGLTLNQLAERNAVLVTEVEKLRAERDQLAAENVAMKAFVGECAIAQGEGNWTSDVDKTVYVPATEWMPPAPATDRIVAGIKADGVDMVLDLISHTKGMLYADSVKEMLYDVSSNLREGADK
ncbi:TPA: hypothetical protein ACWXGW_005222 [Klebsiella pneumoniae]|uniref:hypothetical protein n=1 Tax=Klebsiella pneumoniae TaxID=573 RepID=UPI000F7DE144|nr:hypothetical protein [Klebsiella pneumoniae]RTD25619.1 hypothetical protein EJ887_08275 [Klebsiella pneumoniae subsp. pneumoniae]